MNPPHHLPGKLFAPVDIAPLAIFRIGFGLLMALELSSYIERGRALGDYGNARAHFGYWGLEWVRPLPGLASLAEFWVLIAMALMISAGLFYRWVRIPFALGVVHLFLANSAMPWRNHFYLECLFAVFLCFMPLADGYSLDVRLRRRAPRQLVPAWNVWLFRFQQSVVYFYAGVAKIDADWLRGSFFRNTLSSRTEDVPFIGQFLDDHWLHVALAWSGLLFDLSLPFLLLWRRTRILGLLAGVAFHLLNWRLWDIGIFPHLMILGMILFLDCRWPSWPRRVLGAPRESPEGDMRPSTVPRRLTLGLLAVFAILQIVIPLRHFLYSGPTNWHEQGHRFAWRMMLRTKTGRVEFWAEDRVSGERWRVDYSDYRIHDHQERFLMRPDSILQFAHHLAEVERAHGRDVAIYADARCSLNGRQQRPYTDVNIDLTGEFRTLGHPRWILPWEGDAR